MTYPDFENNGTFLERSLNMRKLLLVSVLLASYAIQVQNRAEAETSESRFKPEIKRFPPDCELNSFDSRLYVLERVGVFTVPRAKQRDWFSKRLRPATWTEAPSKQINPHVGPTPRYSVQLPPRSPLLLTVEEIRVSPDFALSLTKVYLTIDTKLGDAFERNKVQNDMHRLNIAYDINENIEVDPTLTTDLNGVILTFRPASTQARELFRSFHIPSWITGQTRVGNFTVQKPSPLLGKKARYINTSIF